MHLHNNLVPEERFFHWIWENLHFNTRNLQTRSGHTLEILDPGTLNPSDGPDFISSRLHIGNLYLHGNIELHIDEQDWFTHYHHRDPAYNEVILHVVLNENAQRTVRREDGTIPHTVNVKPELPGRLHHFIRRYNQQGPQSRIPCSQHPAGILRDDTFLRQLSRAHRAYFYQKVYELYKFWDHRLPWTQAWKQMLTLSLFDGLGITHNRDSMVRLARYLFHADRATLPKDDLIQTALEIAGLKKDRKREHKDVSSPPPCFNWNRKGVRPNNRPAPRIEQGVQLLKRIQQLPMAVVLQTNPVHIWNHRLLQPAIPGLGANRSDILFGISFIPSLKVAADMHGDKRRGRAVRLAWNMHRVKLPKRFARILDSTHLNRDIYSRCLGTVYQLRHFCFRHRCMECVVFQKAFSS